MPPLLLLSILNFITYRLNFIIVLVQTDTASVLCEAMEYIQFLHEQVKVRTFSAQRLKYEYPLNYLEFDVNNFVLLGWFQVLSAPYLQSTATVQVSMSWIHI